MIVLVAGICCLKVFPLKLGNCARVAASAAKPMLWIVMLTPEAPKAPASAQGFPPQVSSPSEDLCRLGLKQ